MPEFLETIALSEDGIDKAPFPTVPYYLIAAEGDFLYRDTQIGTVLLRETKRPKTLGRVGFAQGVFTWKGEKIPGRITSQAHDFFKRIYQKHNAEAEVLITMHNTTKEFRLFVPYQRVSHGGVKSVYEPTHVDTDYTVVGTLHSHCNFSAFHSGTDSGDASDMDGVHFTIGNVDQATPQIVAMVAMNGKEFHYKNPEEIIDIEYGSHTAPEWWDQYVFPADSPSEKPRSLRSITQAHWDEFRGIVMAQPGHKNRSAGWTSPYSYQKNEKDNEPHKLLAPSQAHKYKKHERWDSWDWDDYEKNVGISNESIEFNRRQSKRFNKPSIPELGAISEAIDLGEENGIFTDKDWNSVGVADMDDITFWRKFYADKMEAVAEIIEVLGMKIQYSISPQRGKR